MMTRNPSYSHIVVVWLVLLAFMCFAVMPSIALAKMEMTIATEGDPDDGLDYSGGGGGYSDDGNNQSRPHSDNNLFNLNTLNLTRSFEYPRFFVVWYDNQLGVFVVYPPQDSSNRRAFR